MTERAYIHQSVLLREAVDYLNPKVGKVYVDGTVGGGGHAGKILQRSSPDGVVIGIDKDPHVLGLARKLLHSFSTRAHLIQGNFSELPSILSMLNVPHVDGIILDLGLSSYQLEDSQRGFSFQNDGPLDMRMDPNTTSTAANLVNRLSEKDLAKMIRQYGEEKWARKIAAAIVTARNQNPISTTGQLAEIVAGCIPRAKYAKKIHPATQTFQALRIAVNHELEDLESFLKIALDLLVRGGRLVIISFHSLEDRLVKQRFRYWGRECRCPKNVPVCSCEGKPLVRILTKRPIRPTEQEVLFNPRARSARMRVVEKV